MRYLSRDDRRAITARFQTLPHPVRLVVFTQARESHSCRSAHDVATEIASCSELLTVEVRDFVSDALWARELGIDRIPSLALLIGRHDPFVRFYGAPTGYQIDVLLDAIEIVSVRESAIPTERRQALRGIPHPMHMRVVVGGASPRCADVVTGAVRLARACDKLRLDVIEVTEYPYLAVRWNITEIPAVILGDELKKIGPASADELYDLLLASA